MKRLLVILLICISLEAGAAEGTCKSTPYTLVPISGYDHAKYAPTPVDRRYDGVAFLASVDGHDDGRYTVAPEWVSVHVRSYSASNPGRFAPGWDRPSTWYKLPLFDEERNHFGETNRIDDSYSGVGLVWNRGHLAQRADANRMGEEYGCNTHVFTNAVPQKAEFNQGIWLGLENYVSGLANEKGDLWITSGPIYDSDTGPTIGDADEIPVVIPDKLFKVVAWEEGIHIETLAFIYPNDDTHPNYLTGRCNSDKTYDHSPFYSSVREIEVATGLVFFSNTYGKHLAHAKTTRTHGLPPVAVSNWVGNCN